jgi:hypothetical protein
LATVESIEQAADFYECDAGLRILSVPICCICFDPWPILSLEVITMRNNKLVKIVVWVIAILVVVGLLLPVATSVFGLF